jgi:hypothetical protein
MVVVQQPFQRARSVLYGDDGNLRTDDGGLLLLGDVAAGDGLFVQFTKFTPSNSPISLREMGEIFIPAFAMDGIGASYRKF